MRENSKAHPEDEAIFEDKISQGGAEQENGRQHNTPDCEDAIGLRQFKEFGDLKASQVIYREQCS